MELTVEQIQALKKEIEGIWTHLNNIETQLAANKAKPAGKASGPSTDETIEMLERMKQKVGTWEQEAEQTATDDLNERIDKTLLTASVRETLDRLKQQLGIR